ncbi:MAG: hypothetical protein A4E48_01346 [Methanosaeta sp. PtaU1.Bin060]|nr:MAG: hypothetical protein A4E48_01346 [Methanosaeta sp. PtaU1.Bin060]
MNSLSALIILVISKIKLFRTKFRKLILVIIFFRNSRRVSSNPGRVLFKSFKKTLKNLNRESFSDEAGSLSLRLSSFRQ